MNIKKQIVVVDIDGTIAKVGDRLKYLKLKPPDYDSFYLSCFDDEPIKDMIDFVKNLYPVYDIVFCTGRREQVREVTAKWLFNQGLYGALLMRPDGDMRHDVLTKPEALFDYLDKSEVAFILEDRNSMVKKWRELGLRCLQVDYGNF
tara:strand:- start:743 stop:1183 length:441 start_codon:yes stop_codon:yes gene_type:complete